MDDSNDSDDFQFFQQNVKVMDDSVDFENEHDD